MTRHNPCPVCGKLVAVDPLRRAIYCSAKCRRKAYYTRLKRRGLKVANPFREQRQCLNCGNSYVAVHPLQRYCSQRCKNQVYYQLQQLKKKDQEDEADVISDHAGAI